MTLAEPELEPVDVSSEPIPGMVPLPCLQHIHEIEIDTERDGPAGCPECGKMIWTAICWFCGAETIDWSKSGPSYDDVVGYPAVTSSGDFMCFDCAVRVEEDEQEESYGEWGDWASS